MVTVRPLICFLICSNICFMVLVRQLICFLHCSNICFMVAVRQLICFLICSNFQVNPIFPLGIMSVSKYIYICIYKALWVQVSIVSEYHVSKCNLALGYCPASEYFLESEDRLLFEYCLVEYRIRLLLLIIIIYLKQQLASEYEPDFIFFLLKYPHLSEFPHVPEYYPHVSE